MSTNETQSESPRWLTPLEAAAHLRISRSALYELVRRHELPHTRVSARCIRLSAASLDEWMRSRERGGSEDGGTR